MVRKILWKGKIKPLSLSIAHLPDQVIRHVTPLTDLQVRILELLGLSIETYTRLTDN